MTRVVDDQIGETLVLKGSDCNLEIHRLKGELVFERHSLILRSRRRVYPLDAVVDLRLRVSERPALSRASVGKILGAALKSAREGKDLEAWGSQEGLDRQLWLRIRTRNERGEVESVEERLSVEGVMDFAGAQEFTGKMSAAAGLNDVRYYSLPDCGLEWRMKAAGLGDSPPPTSLPEDLREIPPAPFTVSEFESTHRVEEWAPGARVRFRKPLSKGALLVLLFALFCLAGAVAALNHALTGDPSSRGGHFIIMGFGLVFGGGSSLILYLCLPETVILDWAALEIRVERWFGKRTLPFGEISRLELEATRIEAGSGDSGGSIKYLAALRAVRHGTGFEESKPFPLVATRSFSHAEDPLWMALPLLYELAAAMGVEPRFLKYERERGQQGRSA